MPFFAIVDAPPNPEYRKFPVNSPASREFGIAEKGAAMIKASAREKLAA
jgi:hypothetical protein